MIPMDFDSMFLFILLVLLFIVLPGIVLTITSYWTKQERVEKDSHILSIDPGSKTGAAIFKDGKLIKTFTLEEEEEVENG